MCSQALRGRQERRRRQRRRQQGRQRQLRTASGDGGCELQQTEHARALHLILPYSLTNHFCPCRLLPSLSLPCVAQGDLCLTAQSLGNPAPHTLTLRHILHHRVPCQVGSANTDSAPQPLTHSPSGTSCIVTSPANTRLKRSTATVSVAASGSCILPRERNGAAEERGSGGGR